MLSLPLLACFVCFVLPVNVSMVPSLRLHSDALNFMFDNSVFNRIVSRGGGVRAAGQPQIEQLAVDSTPQFSLYYLGADSV
jgi:hypothetical protein